MPVRSRWRSAGWRRLAPGARLTSPMRGEGSGRDDDQAAPRPPQAWVGGDSPFPRIGQYAFLSDCETTALVAPSGNVEWLCLPRMDSPSVFGAILDRDAGGFRLGPADIMVPAARRYLPGTMVLETSWATPTGWIIVGHPAATAAHRRTLSAPGLDCPPLAALAGSGPLPGSSLARLPGALGTDPPRADLRTDRRHHRRGHNLPARDARWRAQLGLPLF